MVITKKLLILLALTLAFSGLANAQTNGSISGTVFDSNDAVVPNATVTVKSTTGQTYTATTSDNGSYKIPAVPNGVYTVTASAEGFKQTVTENVKVDVGLPTTVDPRLQVGQVGEIVEVTSGAEVLQTGTAAVGTTITGRQITQTPNASRDALDLVGLLPGTATVGRPRAASINGLPKGAISISIDGVDVQDNVLRSNDGYFTYVRPRVDAIEEVTVSTSNPGAESGGDGAVQIRFATTRGRNNYTGGAYWQVRNTWLNANYWYNNRDLAPLPGSDKAPRQKINLNQYGAKLGGPLPFLNFGEGGPIFNSGKDKSFFFFNYEEFRLPESQLKSRTILSPSAIAGNFSYISAGTTRTVNLLTLAGAAGQINTADPTVVAMLNSINTSAGTSGTITPIRGTDGAVSDPNRLNYSFTPSANQVRKFLTTRFDFNLTKNNTLEFVLNRQKFVPSKDFLNSMEERFPGFPFYGQGSTRSSYSTALRSNFGSSVVNEARFAMSTGLSQFAPGISATDFGYSRGYLLDISAAGISTPYARNSYSERNTPTYDFTDSVTWITGNHSLNFGMQYKEIRPSSTALNRIVPTLSFGNDTSDPLNASSLWSAANFPGATTGQITEAKNLYNVLVGRLTGYTSTAYLSEDGSYQLNGELTNRSRQKTYGLFAQDSWRITPYLTVNFGLRWQPQSGYIVETENYARLGSFAEVYGPSGLGNIFKPGTLTGTATTAVALKKGEEAFPADKKNFSPSFGVVWTPNTKEGSFMYKIFGAEGKSVFRGGYSVAFVREGTTLLESIYSSNPGGNLSATRSSGIGNLTFGTLLRDANNPNLTAPAFSATPAYPITLTPANSANTFSPNLETGRVESYSFGYQRELDQNSVIEFRYVGNRGRNLWRQHNLNELNTIENGFAAEFAKAQSNLYLNQAAGRGNTFAYFSTVAGSQPLPLIMAYLNSSATYAPNNPANYTSSLWSNSTLVGQLSRNNPQAISFGNSVENNATRRANAIANGLPSNFFYVNSTTLTGGAYVVDNSSSTWYDSAVVEFRRRLSAGLRLQASYVWSKAQTDSFQSSSVVFSNYVHRDFGRQLAKGVAVFDVTHQFKVDGTYDLPFGKGRTYLSDSNWFVETFLGGWTIAPVVRWQSGSPFSLGNVQLVGMSKRELQKLVGVYKGPSVVTYLPDDVILNTQKAFNIDPTNTANGGYGTTYGTGGPTGKFIAPAGNGNCVSTYSGQCGFANLILYGPSFFKFDATISKKFKLGEKANVEIGATILDVLNHPNFRVGGWSADVTAPGVGGSTFGQMGSGSAYQDISTTNDPGGRLIDLKLRINF